MKWWPPSLPVRLAAAFVAAVGSVIVLHAVVTAAERRATPPSALPRTAPLLPSPLQALGFRVQPVPGQVRLASRLQALPPDTAPVFEVLADGSVVLRRAAPMALGPAGAAAAGAAGIVLPARSFAALGPAARGSLLELLGALVSARPVPGEAVRNVDLAATPRELAALLAWVP